MNREGLLQHHDEICKTCRDIMVKKNHDYSGSGGENPFANFTRTEDMGICSTEQGFLVRMTDKLSRLSTFVQCGELKVDNESYKDAILDIINYCILMSGYLKSKGIEDGGPQPGPEFLQEEVYKQPNPQGPSLGNKQISGSGKIVKMVEQAIDEHNFGPSEENFNCGIPDTNTEKIPDNKLKNPDRWVHKKIEFGG